MTLHTEQVLTDYVAHFTREGERLVELSLGDLGRRVPTCPGWSMADLLEHVGFAHRWMTEALRGHHVAFPDRSAWRRSPEPGEAWATWLQQGIDDAVEVMRGVSPEARCWGWGNEVRTARWYLRRITHETLVHRLDAEMGAGAGTVSGDPALCVDGIDELGDVFLPLMAGRPTGMRGETLRLHTTDTGDDRWITWHADRVVASRNVGAGCHVDAELRGRAVDLLLAVWGRSAFVRVERRGDGRVSAQLHWLVEKCERRLAGMLDPVSSERPQADRRASGE